MSVTVFCISSVSSALDPSSCRDGLALPRRVSIIPNLTPLLLLPLFSLVKSGMYTQSVPYIISGLSCPSAQFTTIYSHPRTTANALHEAWRQSLEWLRAALPDYGLLPMTSLPTLMIVFNCRGS